MSEFLLVLKPLKTRSFKSSWWNTLPKLFVSHLHFGKLFLPSVRWISWHRRFTVFSDLIFYWSFDILSIFFRVFWSLKSLSIVFLMRFVAMISNAELWSAFFLSSIMIGLNFSSHVMNASSSLLFFNPFLAKSLSWNDLVTFSFTIDLHWLIIFLPIIGGVSWLSLSIVASAIYLLRLKINLFIWFVGIEVLTFILHQSIILVIFGILRDSLRLDIVTLVIILKLSTLIRFLFSFWDILFFSKWFAKD